MAESSTVTILRNKVTEIDARIRAYEREIEIARKNLVAVQMTLAVLPNDRGHALPRSEAPWRSASCSGGVS